MRLTRLAATIIFAIFITGHPAALADEPDYSKTAAAVLAESNIDFASAANEVTQDIQKHFYLDADGLYAHSLSDRRPDFMWGNGIMFSALIAADRHQPDQYGLILHRFFTAMNRYWDRRAVIPGYEPWLTNGNGNDKYYDDNEWMVIDCAEAFAQTHDPRYLDRARDDVTFVLSGWDDQRGGGIWWHEAHKNGSKNTCSNAPAAVGCLRLADFATPDRAAADVAMATRIVDWTTKNLLMDDGLFADSINVQTGHIDKGQLTYNTALMIRAYLGLYRRTGDVAWLHQAQRCADASDWFLDNHTDAYRDPAKWAHLMIEADLEMFRATGEVRLLRRAMNSAAYEYRAWKAHPSDLLIDNASIVRTLWLMTDMETPVGVQFWQRMDHNRN
jgi:hypothetical protein